MPIPQVSGTAMPIPQVGETAIPLPKVGEPAISMLQEDETASPNDPTPTVYLPLINKTTALPEVEGMEFYVAPNGTSNGNGSINNPWDLQTALNQPSSVKPGATIWLRGGRYGNGGGTIFNSKLAGTNNQPIILRQIPGERATIDGGIMAYGQYSWFWDFEITNSSLERVTDGYHRSFGLNMLALGQKAINLVVNNTGHPGIGFWSEVGTGGEIYGAIIWGVGLYDTSFVIPYTERGSGIYAQNESGDRFIEDVITFRNFTTGMKAYSENGYANGFNLEGNVSFSNYDRNFFIGTTNNPIDKLSLTNNFTYREDGDLGISTEFGLGTGALGDNQNIVAIDNYFVSGSRKAEFGAFSSESWLGGTIANNTFVSRDLIAAFTPSAGTANLTWNNNQYFGPINNFWYSNRDGSYDYLTYDQWKAKTGFDANSTYSPSLPSGVKIFVRPNKYETGRANIIIYNWDMQPRVSVDVSSVLKPGDTYRIVDAQNFFGDPVAVGTYDGKTISLPMDLTAVAPIIGNVSHIHNQHSSLIFGVFVLFKTSE